MATIQFIGTPTFDAPEGCEAGVVALKIRSNQSTDAVAQSLDALSWLTRQGCTQFLYNIAQHSIGLRKVISDPSAKPWPRPFRPLWQLSSGLPPPAGRFSWVIYS